MEKGRLPDKATPKHESAAALLRNQGIGKNPRSFR